MPDLPNTRCSTGFDPPRYLEPTHDAGRAFAMRNDVAAFLTPASHAPYLAGIGHRTAVLEDSRLLLLAEVSMLVLQSLFYRWVWCRGKIQRLG